MINNNSNIERMDYISNHTVQLSIEKLFSKTHAPVFGIGLLEKF
jgi:hypothetical protein